MSRTALPAMCYAEHPVDGSTVIIEYGVLGWAPAKPMSAVERREHNQQLGLLDGDERVMILASMFGWEAPAVLAHFQV